MVVGVAVELQCTVLRLRPLLVACSVNTRPAALRKRLSLVDGVLKNTLSGKLTSLTLRKGFSGYAAYHSFASLPPWVHEPVDELPLC